MKEKHRFLLMVITVIIASAILIGCQNENNPASSNLDVFFSSERTIRTGMVDYGHHTLNKDYKEFIAKHFDYVVTGEQDIDFDYFKTRNPDILIFAYWNSILLTLDQAQPASESAFLHGLSAANSESDPTKRIGRIFDSQFHYVMDVGSSDWRSHSLNAIIQLLNNGFDGIHLDDVYAHLMHEAHFNSDEPYLIGQPDNYATFTTTPAWYNAQQSHDDYRAFISYINGHTAKKVIFNGINDVAEDLHPIRESRHPKDYLQVCGGSVQEGFVYNGLWVANPEDGFFGDEYWESILDILINIPAGKLHGVVSYGDVNYQKGRMYSFASFLIGYNPNKTVSYYYAPNEFTLTYLPEWNLNIGKPIESFSSIHEYKDREHIVFKREFENALVIVNPYSSTTSLIVLDNDYCMIKKSRDVSIKTIDGEIKVAIGEKNQLTFEPVSSVLLEGYSAVVLMKMK